ncbi:uncharacterized protein LOC143072021 isoform X1 [Mytilus galloprovincialis]|uniref:uncharacterized protein LOC143072021 isoform X1 n=1 Tax=Mytilus galloprovincialis TaxID=29158 RepID=UPI003F7C3F43
MSASKSRRSQIDEEQGRNMGPQAGSSREENVQSSDSDEISFIEENQTSRNKKVKKTARKVISNEDEILERTLRESGIDIADMTREEKVALAQVIMMSKEEAEIHSQSFGDESMNHSDSEEEKQTTDAFMQAMHPKQNREATQDTVIPESLNANIYNQETQENKSDIYNQGTQENQSNNNKKSYDSYMDQSTVDIQPTLDAATGRFDISEHASPVNSQLDPVSQVVLHLSQQNSSAFEEAIHPPSPIDVDMMEENPVPKEIEKQKNTLSVKPIQQKQLKKQHMSRKIDKNQPRIDNFSHVITDEKQDIIDNQDVQAVISEDDSSQERKKTRVFKKTATAIRDDISDTEALSLKDVVEANKNFTLAQPKEEVDARRNFTQAQLKELMSEDEDSPVKRVVKVEESPIKRVVKSAKKAFAWNDSDEETQDFLTIKNENIASVEDKQNISPRANASNTVNDDLVEDEIVKDEPFTEEFYEFPSLKRHYRNVKKKENSAPTLFAPLDSNPKDYTKAILQLFTLYHNKLARLQKLSKSSIKWSKEPVRVGFHLDHTIDARKRGLNYDFLDDQEASTSVVPIVVDMKENTNPQRPASKNFSMKIRKEPKVQNNADEEINQFVDTFVSKPGLRSRRTRNTGTFTKEKSAYDFEPYPVDETFKVGAEKGKKRKLYNETETKYCPLIEDESSNDFDDKFVGKGKRNMKLKKQNNEGNSEVPEKLETKSSRNKSNISDPTTNVKKATRGSLKRHASDLSTGSVESFKSDDMNNLLNPDQALSRSPELSLGGLSQKSDVLLDADGQLYSTQLCSMIEKRARVPVSKSSFNLDTVDDDSVQYLSQNSRNGSNLERAALSQNISRNVESTSTQSNFRPILPKQKEDSTSQVSQKQIGKTKTAKIIVIHPSQSTVKNVEPVGQQSTLKSRMFGHMSDLFKLGSGNKSSSSKIKNDDDPQGSHIRNKSFGDDEDLDTETHRFQPTSDVTVDDIQQINMKTGGIRTYSKKQGRKRQLTNEETEPNKQPKIITVPCPLCNKQFPQDQIENHAADCNGPVDDDNSRESTDSVQIQEIQAGRNLEQSTSGVQRHGQGRASKKQDQDADFIVEDVESPRKSFSMECYICDKSFRNKKMLEQHVEKCLDEATQMQHEIETRGMDSILEPGEISPRKRATRSARTTEPNEGYSSGSDEEKVTLRDVIKANQSTSSSEESSYSDEYDWSPAKTPPNHKVTNKENQLPGGWTLEELQNSPIRSFVPIWKQSDNEGFKTQFDKAKKRFEKQQLKGKGKRKQKGTKRKRGKRKSKKKPAAKRQRCTE